MGNPIKEAFSKVKEDILVIKTQIQAIREEISELKRTLSQTDTRDRQTDRQEIQTVPQEVEGLKPQNSIVSIGNEGVQTDRQTHRQTDRQDQKFALDIKPHIVEDPISKIEKVTAALASLDQIKKELRSQFKQLTNQEMLVFTTIYQLEEAGNTVDYTLLAQRAGLSESSIRDYVQKIIKKGIPLDKARINNKQITLSIHPELKRIASLQTIISLREL